MWVETWVELYLLVRLFFTCLIGGKTTEDRLKQKIDEVRKEVNKQRRSSDYESDEIQIMYLPKRCKLHSVGECFN